MSVYSSDNNVAEHTKTQLIGSLCDGYRLLLICDHLLDSDIQPSPEDFSIEALGQGFAVKATHLKSPIKAGSSWSAITLLMERKLPEATEINVTYRPHHWLMWSLDHDKPIAAFDFLTQVNHMGEIEGLSIELAEFEHSDEPEDFVFRAHIHHAFDQCVQITFDCEFDMARQPNPKHFRAELEDQWLTVSSAYLTKSNPKAWPELWLILDEQLEEEHELKITYKAPDQALLTSNGISVNTFTTQKSLHGSVPPANEAASQLASADPELSANPLSNPQAPTDHDPTLFDASVLVPDSDIEEPPPVDATKVDAAGNEYESMSIFEDYLVELLADDSKDLSNSSLEPPQLRDTTTQAAPLSSSESPPPLAEAAPQGASELTDVPATDEAVDPQNELVMPSKPAADHEVAANGQLLDTLDEAPAELRADIKVEYRKSPKKITRPVEFPHVSRAAALPTLSSESHTDKQPLVTDKRHRSLADRLLKIGILLAVAAVGWVIVMLLYFSVQISRSDKTETKSLPPQQAHTTAAATTTQAAQATAAVQSGDNCHLQFKTGTYEGACSNNKPDGYGEFSWTSGNHYKGEWVNGMRQGKGTLTFSNGDVYTGEFQDNMQHGLGTMQWHTGARYHGQYRNGELHGQGTYWSVNGDRYEGAFRNGKVTNDGYCYEANGTTHPGAC